MVELKAAYTVSLKKARRTPWISSPAQMKGRPSLHLRHIFGDVELAAWGCKRAGALFTLHIFIGAPYLL